MDAVAPREPFAIEERDVDGVRIVAVSGELDVATAPRLRTRVDVARAAPVSGVLVDLTGVDFCDSTGLLALIATQHELQAHGRRLAIVCSAAGQVARLFEIAGARATLAIFGDAAAGLSALAPLKS